MAHFATWLSAIGNRCSTGCCSSAAMPRRPRLRWCYGVDPDQMQAFPKAG